MEHSIIIAVDGFSSCGKSTLAKALAQELAYLYIDSGAMYRAVTLYFLRNQVDWNKADAVAAALKQITIRFTKNEQGQVQTLLNGENVEQEIRQMEVSNSVSPVAAVPAVRRFLVKQQQAMGETRGIVMDGRDIGTVVFPQAALKIFLTASAKERARRRFLELKAKGQPVPLDEIAANLTERDHIDSNRADSPLKQAEDAVVVDNTNITEQEQLLMTLALAKERIRTAAHPASSPVQSPKA